MHRLITGITAGTASALLLAFASPALSGGGGCGAGKTADMPAANSPVMLQARAEGKDIVDTAVAAGQFKTLAAALNAAGLIDALKGKGPFTVFAPTDEAFAKLPAGTVETLLKPENKDKLTAILKYHVVSGLVTSKSIGDVPVAATLSGRLINPSVEGGSVMVDKANVVKADIGATNGVIHVIDSVLIPESKTIPQVAIDDGRFTTLVAALKAAGLVETLSGAGPFTVFAPTDDAFAKLPKPVLGALLKPENKGLLTEILTYHVVSGRVSSVDAIKAGKAKTLEGSQVSVSGSSGSLMANSSRVIIEDLDTANGVVHVVDSVLIPEKAAAKIAKLSMATPEGVMELAINRGAPMFNNGNHAACAAIYEVALNALMAMPESAVDAGDRMTISNALAEGAKTHDMGDRAWTYRRAMDSVMSSSEQMATR
ncbi:MAG: fasciclin domain-containing protein [Phycisphaerales bacterium]